jgi:hypothetical protein
MESTNDEIRELSLLEQIESDPNVNQSALATQLGGLTAAHNLSQAAQMEST